MHLLHRMYFCRTPEAYIIDDIYKTIIRLSNHSSFGSFVHTSSTRMKSGKLIFGGSRGIVVIDPAHFAPENIPPKVYLTGYRVYNETVHLGTAYELQGVSLFAEGLILFRVDIGP